MKQRRAKSFQRSISKVAAASAESYFQRDPQSGKYRGIVEYSDGSYVRFLPEKPLISDNLDQLKLELAKLVSVPVMEKGMSEPWFAESNMPFDAQGNRAG